MRRLRVGMHMFMLWQQSALGLRNTADAARLPVFGLLRHGHAVQFYIGGWSAARGEFTIRPINPEPLSLDSHSDMLGLAVLVARLGRYMSWFSSKLVQLAKCALPLARLLSSQESESNSAKSLSSAK